MTWLAKETAVLPSSVDFPTTFANLIGSWATKSQVHPGFLTPSTIVPIPSCGATTEEEKRQYFLSSDIYVSLSEHEGFGIPLVEAMHYGLPVVAYEAAAVRETLGGKGLLLDSKKPTEVAAVVHEILQDDQILNSLASDGYQRAEELSFELNLEEYKRVLSPLISG